MNDINNINDLKIDIDFILNRYLYSDKLSDKYIKKLSDYINLLSIEELIEFKTIAEDLKYKKKYYGMKKYKITNNAVELMLKIFNQTDVKTFPYIERIARKGWSISDGTFAWSMYKLENYPSDISCDMRVNLCLMKNIILENDIFNGFDFIWAKRKD